MTDVFRRLRYWTESARRSEALREEMALHLAEKAAELQADGMTAERARAEACRRLGNVGLKHEESREPLPLLIPRCRAFKLIQQGGDNEQT